MTRSLTIACVLAGCGGGHAPLDPDATLGSDGAAAVPDSAGPSAIDACFPLADLTKPHPDYNPYHPIVNADCTGTNYQDITNVERVVFLGDSITAGTPPTLISKYYRSLVGDAMKQKFGTSIEIANCSAWGAKTADLAAQIESCLPGVQNARTLIVMTIGGNDMNAYAKDAMTDTPAQTLAKVDESVARMDAALTRLLDPAHFPHGSFVVFSNVYEFTDGTRDLQACPAAGLAGFNMPAPAQMVPAHLHLQEEYMRLAVAHHVDMVFSLERFCGHGFRRDDATGQCYLGPGTALWFDPFTCIHPNTDGHAELARMFETTVAD